MAEQNDVKANVEEINASKDVVKEVSRTPADTAAEYIQNTKIVLISVYQIIIKKVTEAFYSIQNFCKKAYETISEKLSTNEEAIEV